MAIAQPFSPPPKKNHGRSLTWRRCRYAAVLFVRVISTVIAAIAYPDLIHTRPIGTGHLVAVARTVLFVGLVSAVVVTVTPPIHINAFAISALEFP